MHPSSPSQFHQSIYQVFNSYIAWWNCEGDDENRQQPADGLYIPSSTSVRASSLLSLRRVMMINLYNYQLLQNFMDKSISYIISFINQRLYGIKMDLHLSRNLTCMCRQIVSTTISSAVYTSTCFSGSSVFFPSCSSKKLPHNIPQMLLYPVTLCVDCGYSISKQSL